MSLESDLGRARGIPLFDDPGPWLRLLEAAGRHDFRDLDNEGLLGRAKDFREASRRALDEGSGPPLPVWLREGPSRQEYPAPPTQSEAGRRLEALALAREAARRALGLEPFQSQLVAALAMVSGFVAELPTGEGKTLAAALTAATESLCGGSVHVLTANDYLARRDAAWMGPLHALLGLEVASVTAADDHGARRLAWKADIVHTTAVEAGFDFLRDGLAERASDLLSPRAGLCLVDEADFVLLDEARVPLVIAAGEEGGDGEEDIGPARADRLARDLVEGVHWRADLRSASLRLTDEGAAALESLCAGDRSKARVHAALYARNLLSRDVDYLVREGRARPLDSFTGRVAEKRRWPWGVQAAIEAKEGMATGPEGRIFGMLTIEHLAALYPRLGAMTATARHAAPDFALMYGLGTLVVEPHLPSRRTDLPDAVFHTRQAALEALARDAAAAFREGRPVLVATTSVPESRKAASLVSAAIGRADAVDQASGPAREGKPVIDILNAWNDEEEAAIIARAGEAGRVTVSTNMAGRGVDIRLGPAVAEAGGLCVLGLGRRASRREEDQLRGRAGRQGDPGSSRFYASLEDPLFVSHGVPDFLPRRFRASPPDGREIAEPAVLRELERARSIIANQQRLERVALRKFSLIVEFDRRAFRALRDSILAGGELPGEAGLAAREAAEADPSRAAEILDSARVITLDRLDAAWAGHLALVEELREGAGLLRYGGLDPGMEYARRAADAYEEGQDRAIREAAAAIRARKALGQTAEDLEAGGEGRPKEFWTYVMEAEELPAVPVLASAGLDLGAAIARAAATLLAAVTGASPRACPRGTSGRSSGDGRDRRS